MKSHSLLFAALLAAATLSAADHPVIPLWPAGAPGSEARKNEPEKIAGTNVSNIHHPSLTVYLPAPEKATGTAIIVVPGGGHQRLAIQHEGYNVAEWLAAHGIAAFVLKHRLEKDDATPAGSPQPYKFDVHGLADGQRAMRLVRSRAAEWGLNPAAIGMIGFSAGGEIVNLVALRSGTAAAPLLDAASADPIERVSARPDFQALIYPGKSQLIVPTKDSPPVFLACGFGDRKDISEGLANVYLLFKQAGVPAELHIFAGVGHGFGLRATNKGPVAGWPDRLREWLVDRKFLKDS
jgi:endo-1,4-beta-xylanase